MNVTVYRIEPDKDGKITSALEHRQKLNKYNFNQLQNVKLAYLGKWDDLELLKQAKD